MTPALILGGYSPKRAIMMEQPTLPKPEMEGVPDRAPALLTAVGVRSGYGQLEILHGLDLTVWSGEIVTLIGSNGAGKTTTLNTLCGVVPLRAGTLTFAGQSIAGYSPDALVRLGISQVPEGRKLFGELTVLENLQLGAFTRRDRPEIRQDLDKMFALFPRLAERRAQRAGSMSGGEQQMCAIARGLMARPKLLLLDEPSLGLAPLLVEQIFEIIQTVNKEGMTILLVEQNANMALAIADRGYVLANGSIVLTGTGAKLLGNDEVRRSYLGDMGH